MDAQTVIDSYVNDVAAHLPRRQRNDVGFELRTLLTEELEAAADKAGRAPDEQLAMEVVQDFGQPDVVAAHYSPRGFELIEPEHVPTFVMLALAVVAVQWLVTLPRVFVSDATFGEWAAGPGLGALSWVGLLVAWFGVATWIRRRSPVDPETHVRPWTHWIFWLPVPRTWRPVDYAADARRMGSRLIPLGSVAILFFISPHWWLQLLLPSGTGTSWTLYDESFRHWMWPPFLALMLARLVLLIAAVVSTRLWARTEGVRGALWFCFVALLMWVLFGWRIFADSTTDALFKVWLLVFTLVNAIQLIAWMRRASLRVRTPRGLAAGKSTRAG
jgi:hypothetical protein